MPESTDHRGPRTEAGRELVKAVKDAIGMNPDMKAVGHALTALVENGVIRAENEARREAMKEPIH